jgi:hypothetical protein
MDRMVPARRAELLQLQAILVLLLVLCRSVVAVLAVTALHCNDFAHRVPNLSWLPGFGWQQAPSRLDVAPGFSPARAALKDGTTL